MYNVLIKNSIIKQAVKLFCIVFNYLNICFNYCLVYCLIFLSVHDWSINILIRNFIFHDLNLFLDVLLLITEEYCAGRMTVCQWCIHTSLRNLSMIGVL